MSRFLRKPRFCQLAIFVLLSSFILSVGLLLTGPASTADYPPAGSEITSLQEAYNQANDGDTIRAKTKVFSESLVLDRPFSVNLNGGYSDSTYSETNGSTSLQGTLVIRNGTVRVSNIAVSGNSGGGLAISNVAVTVPRIDWTTDQLADGRVDFGETTSYGLSVSGADLSTSHSLVLTGLKPNTTYHFIVSSSTSTASAASVDSTFTTPAFIAASIGDIGNSAVIEVSGNFDAKNADGSLNVVARQAVAQEYFKTHSDNVDFLVMLSTFDYAMPDTVSQGFYTPVKNDVAGISQVIFDHSSQFGSNGKLQGVINKGNVTSIVNNPLDPSFEGALNVLSHEIMHRWGAYVTYQKPDNSISSDLLGKDDSHWSYLLDTSSSLMYGSAWLDNGDGTFTATSIRSSYSYLDLYLMGMIDKTQVPPMLLINNPAIDKTQLPQAGATVSGTSTTVTIDNIIAAQGDRLPLPAQAQKTFRVGFVLLIHPGDSAGTSSATVEALRKAWAGKFAALTGTAGKILNVAPELSITLAPTINGSTTTGPDVLVEGTFLNTTGNETGITVNSIPAAVFGNRFIVNHVPLQAGANTITVTATDTSGQTSTTTATVTSVVADYVRLRADSDSGLAPLTVNFTIEGSLAFTNITFNSNGPVMVDISANTDGTGYSAKFPAEGIYTISVNALGSDSQIYQDNIKVVVISELETDRFIRQKWDGMKKALFDGNISGAVSNFNEDSQGAYQALFQEMSANLPEIATNMRSIDLDYITQGTAEYRISRTETINDQQQDITYFIYFVKNKDGLWKINQM
jgi:Glucodextranase, domain B